MNPSGTKCKVVIPRWNREVDMSFDEKGSGVTIQVMGADKPVRGIWAMNNNLSELIIISPSGYGWWNSVYSFDMNGDSGTGNYMGYESPIGMAYLEPCQISKVS